MLTKPTLLGHLASVLLLCSSSMVAMAADETEPNNDKNTTNEIAVGGILNGKISSVSDTDWFKLTGIQAGNSYEIKAINVGRDVDVALELTMPDGSSKSINNGFEGDDETIPFNATVDATVVPGNYFVRVTQTGLFGGDMGYTLTLTENAKVAGSIKAPDNEKDIPAGTLKTVNFQLLNSDKTAVGMQGKTISFTLTKPDKTSIPLESGNTDDKGEVSVDLKEANGNSFLTMKGDYTLTATFETVSSDPVTLTVIPATPHHLKVSDTVNEVPTYIAQTLTFGVFDQYENPVKAGQTIDVQITKPDGATATLEPSSPLTTNAEGQVKVVFTPDQAVVYTIKALSPPTEVMTVESSLPMLVGEATDNKSPITFTLKHKDKWIDGQQIEVSSQPVADILEPSSALTTKDGGKVTVSLKGDTVPGNYTVSAKLSSSKTTDSGGQEVYAVKSDDVTVTISPTAPDSLTVKGGEESQIISSDTASAQITFELQAGEKPADGTLNLSLKKPDEKSTACLVEATEKDCTTPVTTLEVKNGEGRVWLKDAKLAGDYTITATLQDSKSSLTKEVKVTVNAGTPANLTIEMVGKDKLSRQVQHLTLAEASKAREIVFNLTDKDGNAVAGQVNFEIKLAPAEASTPPAEASTPPAEASIPPAEASTPVVCLGIDADKPCTEDNVSTATVDAKTGQVKVFLKGLEIGEYTVVATLGNTEVKAKAEVVVEVGNLAVTEGGNQTIVVPQSPFEGTVINKSTVITFTLKDGAGVDEISSKTSAGQEVKDKTVTLTLTDDSLGNPVTGLGLVEDGKNDGTPQNLLTLPTNAKGEVKIIFQAPATVVSEAEPVAAYKITAKVNGLEEYTEVFVVTKAVKELVETDQRWPSLATGESLNKNDDTECLTGGWAWNARGKPQPTTAAFYGGLQKETEAFLATVPEVKVDPNDRGKGGDQVVVQGVIKVDDKDKKDKVAGLFVLGENGSYTKTNPAD